METGCINCKQGFVKGPKGYNRTSLSSLTSPKTVRRLFPQSAVDLTDLFLCSECVKLFKKKTIIKRTGQRKRTWNQRATPMRRTATPVKRKTPMKWSPLKKKRRTSMFGDMISKAIMYLERRDYLHAFRWLAHHGTQSSKSAFIKVFCEVIKKERVTLTSTTVLSEPVSEESISAFTWTQLVEETEETCPAISSTLQSFLPDARHLPSKWYGPKKNKQKMTVEEAQALLHQRVGLMLSIALFSVKPKKHKFFQSCLGIQLWREGCPHKIFQTLNDLGLSQNADAARGHIDRLRSGHDRDIKQWKKNIETCQNPKSAVTPEQTCRKKLFKSSSAGSYGVCWDNVQIQTHTKHQGSSTDNKFLLWGMCLGVKNRVNFQHLLPHTDVIPAKELSPYSFLPTADDYRNLKDHMVVIVERILVEYVPALAGIKQAVEWHIPHKYSQEMTEQSHVVNLGVVQADPASTSGCIDIMTHLHQYVPIIDDKVVSILCSGDGLSVERMVGAHQSRKTGATEALRLDGLVESPQEFHKEILLMQDTMNIFFKSESEAARGTLFQMKNFFKHKSVKKVVKANVQHVWDLLLFATSSYVVLCAMTVLEMANLKDVPSSYPVQGSLAQKLRWLESTALKVVDFAWLAPQKDDIRRAAESVQFDNLKKSENIYPYCICMIDKDEPMIQCCSSRCTTTWTHLSCAGLTDLPNEDEDWFCSTDCMNDKSYIYCICKRRTGGRMVQCFLKDKCNKYEWYHLNCLGKNDDEQLPDRWYCSDDCALGSLNDDPVQNYSRAIMWEGLNLLVRRDAVREGNGEQILSHWKMDMLSFWTKGHYKYFIIGHQLLAGTAGYLPESLRQDLTWNRLANLSGKKGNNIGLDLVNEFLNNDFKEMLKVSRGQYTNKQVDRSMCTSWRSIRQED